MRSKNFTFCAVILLAGHSGCTASSADLGVPCSEADVEAGRMVYSIAPGGVGDDNRKFGSVPSDSCSTGVCAIGTAFTFEECAAVLGPEAPRCQVVALLGGPLNECSVPCLFDGDEATPVCPEGYACVSRLDSPSTCIRVEWNVDACENQPALGRGAGGFCYGPDGTFVSDGPARQRT